MTQGPRYLTTTEVAERWAVSQRWVQQLVQRGGIASTRFGRSIRIPISAVEAYERGNTSGGGRRGS